MPPAIAPPTTIRLPDEAYILLMGLLRAWVSFTHDYNPLRGIQYDRVQVKAHIPESRPPMPDHIADFAVAYGSLAERDRQILWLYYIVEVPRGDIDIAGRYGVHQQTAYRWRHAALRQLAERLGLLGEGGEA